jgi:hypothetical protein
MSQRLAKGEALLALGFRNDHANGATFGKAFRLAETRLQAGEAWETIVPDLIKLRDEIPTYLELRKQPLAVAIAADAETEAEEKNLYDAKTKIQELSRVPVVEAAALMPDTCIAGSEFGCIPVGGAILTPHHVIPSAHSADVCCSMHATFFESSASTKSLMDALQASTVMGPYARKKGEEIHHPILDQPVWSNPFLRGLEGSALRYLGTQGDGNHFAYIGQITIDEKFITALETEGYYDEAKAFHPKKETTLRVLVTHHGSRHFGAQVFKRGLEQAITQTEKIARGIPKTGAWLDIQTPLGKAYWEALNYVRDWTKANHQVIHDLFLKTGLGPTAKIATMGNAHNFVWEENGKIHHGKGATPAWRTPQGQKSIGIIPLNMGREILVTFGEANPQFLQFSPHGAGRNLSRSETLKPYTDPKTGKHDEQKIAEEVARQTAGLDIRWGSKPDLSESPIGYKDASKVKAQLQKFGLATVIAEIQPTGCIMAGHTDPFWKKEKELKKQKKQLETPSL